MLTVLSAVLKTLSTSQRYEPESMGSDRSSSSSLPEQQMKYSSVSQAMYTTAHSRRRHLLHEVVKLVPTPYF